MALNPSAPWNPMGSLQKYAMLCPILQTLIYLVWLCWGFAEFLETLKSFYCAKLRTTELSGSAVLSPLLHFHRQQLPQL